MPRSENFSSPGICAGASSTLWMTSAVPLRRVLAARLRENSISAARSFETVSALPGSRHQPTGQPARERPGQFPRLSITHFASLTARSIACSSGGSVRFRTSRI